MKEGETVRDRLRHEIDHAAHLLPAQGPIGVFVHHNTLHAFQHMPFSEGVEKASKIFGAEPYLTEERYRREMAAGRIGADDIDAVLADTPNDEVAPGVYRRYLIREMLIKGMREFPAETIRWRLEEGDLAGDFREAGAAALFHACYERTHEGGVEPADKASNAVYELIHPWLIRLCSAYLDQGMSYWPMPGREEGFYPCVRKLLSSRGALLPIPLAGLADEFRGQAERGASAEDVVLEFLGGDETRWAQTLERELLALPGWPGLFRQLELTPALAPHQMLACSLIDFLAIRLTLARVAAAYAKEQPAARPLRNPELTRLARAATVYDAARAAGVTTAQIWSWAAAQFAAFALAVAGFDSLARRGFYHLAYEHWHEQEILQGLAAHRNNPSRHAPPGRPPAQVFFCLDEREESMRRAIEEVDPRVGTYGAAGFYSVAVNYKGIDDALATPHCPIVVKPQHAVSERPAPGHEESHRARVERRYLLSRLMRGMFVSSRSLVRGALSTAVLGLFSAFPLIVRVLAPRRYAVLRAKLEKAFLPEPATELALMRDDAESHQAVQGLLSGFSIVEKADRVAGLLASAGLPDGHARVVVILGHGSRSLNNPHESAYCCGACGGRHGGPNARLFAAMANNPRVRELLPAHGVRIAEDTWFVGGEHDTCSDGITLFDTELTPISHQKDLEAIADTLAKARALNARERTRRFASCSDDVTPKEALRHVEERSQHLAEARPEYGHSSNSICIVGRREMTRGLFLDRRAFLTSYDATHDPTGEYLGKLLAAAVPVCAGINLEYFFSTTDNEIYGCGTKLPHNVAGLMGVMNGQGSDLRTGLTLQMVEIHEPVRILFVIETVAERMDAVIASNAEVREFIDNEWARLALMHPETGEISIRKNGSYVPFAVDEKWKLPRAANAAAWYRGNLGHLRVASIGKEIAA